MVSNSYFVVIMDNKFNVEVSKQILLDFFTITFFMLFWVMFSEMTKERKAHQSPKTLPSPESLTSLYSPENIVLLQCAPHFVLYDPSIDCLLVFAVYPQSNKIRVEKNNLSFSSFNYFL